MDESSDLLQGQCINGRYEIQRLIGEGGMGTVYLAKDRHLPGRKVAVKALHRRYVGRKDREQRFINESTFSAITGRVPYHTNLAATIDSGRIDGERPFLVMEYVDGPAISGLRVELGRPLSAEEVCHLAIGIASALQVLHDADIVHRDLTPMNVLIATTKGEWVPKVIDLSHAASISGPQLHIGHPERLTQPHEVPGTPGYMSPGQVAREYPSPAMDIFSFGVMLWELLAGRHAYRERDRSQYFDLQRCAPRPPAPLVEVRPDLPKTLYRIVDSCTRTEANKRPSIREVLRLLDVVRFEMNVPGIGVANDAPPVRPSNCGGAGAPPAAVVVKPATAGQPRRDHGSAANTRTDEPIEALAVGSEMTRWTRWAAFVALAVMLGLAAVGVIWILLREPTTVPPEKTGSNVVEEEAEPESPRAVDPPEVSPPPVPPPAAEPEDDGPIVPKEPPAVAPSGTRAKQQKRRKRARVANEPNEPPPCTDVAADARQAVRARAWGKILELTQSRRCWDDDALRLELRVRGFKELGRYAECARVAKTSAAPEIDRLSRPCFDKLANENTP